MENARAGAGDMDGMESIALDTGPLGLSSSDYRSAIAGSSMSLSLDDEEDDDSRHHPLLLSPSSDLFTGNKDRESNFYGSAGESDEGSENGKQRDIKMQSQSQPQVQAHDFLNISVGFPEKVQDTSGSSIVPGANIYVSYLVVTRTNIAEYEGTEFSVRRRFRDFVTLADRLAESYRGYFIPPRPDKSIVESQVMKKQEFIEQRRISLEKYLCRLAAHPVFRKCDELKVFLQTTGKLPFLPSIDIASRMLDGAAKLPKQLFGDGGSSVVAPEEAVQPAKGGRDLIRIFKELRQSVTNDWGGSKPPVLEEDKEFVEKKEKLQELEHELTDASQQAEALVKAQQEVSEALGALGLALIRVSKLEGGEGDTNNSNSQKAFAIDSKRIATAAMKACRFYRESNACSVKHLDELHNYLGLMQAVHAAFGDRSSALLTVQTLLSDVASMESRISKLSAASSKVFGGDSSRIRKIEELTQSIQLTNQARDCAQAEYGRIKERNRAELERYELEKQRDFFDMLKGFVQAQVEFSEKVASVWTKAADEATAVN